MSNLETPPLDTAAGGVEPGVEIAEGAAAETPAGGVEILEPREVPLGGPRAMHVRRTLPQRRRSLIGAWCFVDHYGPDPVTGPRAMDVPPHPHTGLQTVSWLFAGEIEHRDSVGSHAMVRPGELNLMTAGRGIQHSEYSTEAATTLHGVQLWVALPEQRRHGAPDFEHHVAHPVRHGDATLHVFIGALAGGSSDATAHTPLVGAQLDLPAGASVELPVDPGFEHGLLVDAGAAVLQDTSVSADQLAYVPAGLSTLRIEAGDAPLRAVLIGGTPFGEPIVMWWNFVGRSHDEVVAYRAEWQRSVAGAGQAGAGIDDAPRFGAIDDPAAPLPAPELPNVRLRARD